MSQYVSPYAYRLPPDTFLQRRDPSWYIGATPEQQAEVSKWSAKYAELRASESHLIAQGNASTDKNVKWALLNVALPQVQAQIADALMHLQAAQKAAGMTVAVPTAQSFARLEALVATARRQFEANAEEWIGDMQAVIGRLTPDFVASMRGVADNIRRNVFEGSIPRLMVRVQSGEVGKQKDIEHLLKISAAALKSQYEDAARAFRDMGPISTLVFRIVSGLVQSAEAIGRYTLEVVTEKVRELIKEAQDQALKNPLGLAVVAGGALAVLALYFSMRRA